MKAHGNNKRKTKKEVEGDANLEELCGILEEIWSQVCKSCVFMNP